MSKQDARERTEPPTSRRLRKLREQGSVAKSRDLPSAVALAGLLIVFCLAWPWYLDQFKEIVSAPFVFLDQPFQNAAGSVAEAVGIKAFYILGPLLFGAVFLAVVTDLVQIGPLFSVDPILPKMERLNPAEGLKRFFSLPHLVEAVKAVTKTLVLGGALYYLLKDALRPLVFLSFHEINNIVQITAMLFQSLFLVTIIVFLMLSLVDVVVQKRLFLHENRMSKDDVKRDHKEAEGDPFIKGKQQWLRTLINTPEAGDDAPKERFNDIKNSR